MIRTIVTPTAIMDIGVDGRELTVIARGRGRRVMRIDVQGQRCAYRRGDLVTGTTFEGRAAWRESGAVFGAAKAQTVTTVTKKARS